MSLRRAILALLVALLALAAFATCASASFGPIELQSVGPHDQFEDAGEPAIAADGRYLAFEGTLDGVKGIFRKDLQSGQLQLVAGGSIYTPQTGAPTDASAPSISADGQYVSFSTTTALVAAAHAGSNVYVRDMDVESNGAACASEAESADRCAFELASALSTPGGATEGLTYYSGAGAVASGRVSLSANGREVAFVIAGESNLTSEAGGSTPGVHTPGLQVAVRYLETGETVLVSAERDSASGQMTGLPVEGGAVTVTSSGGPGAALSADGSTVAWLGAEIPKQAPTLSDEATLITNDDSVPARHYDEPLWRRIADRAGAPTRRIVGGGDPLAPGCPAGGTLAMPACQGPFPELASASYDDQESHLGWRVIDGYEDVPQLSADGRTVALIGDPDGTSNVFVANMSEGLDRVQALRQLTQEVPVFNTIDPGTDALYLPGSGDIYNVAISPDGTRIAFTTQREQFLLEPPYFDEPPLSQLGVDELYQIDLGSDTLERITHGPTGGPSLEGESPVSVTEKGARSPTFTENGSTLAFADSASNLVFGDANDASDVFTVTEPQTAESGQPGATAIGSPPIEAQPAAQWRLSVVAVTHPDGTATLDAVVPGAGRLTASASATVPVKVGVARRARGAKRSSRGPVSGSRSELQKRTVANSQMPAGSAGMLEVPLRVGAPYVGALESAAGIYALVRVTFAGSGGPVLTQTLALALRRVEPKHTAVARHAARRPRRKHGRRSR